MRKSKVLAGTVALAAAFAASMVFAQTTAGSATVQVLPIVAQTSSYATEIFVLNPHGASLVVNVKFYEALTSSVPGLRSCNALTVKAYEILAFALGTQCTLGAGNHHGMLLLESADAEKTRAFFAYSRSQTPGGNGFSVEGFPIGNFSGQNATVLGIKRIAAAPVYQTNCFIGALGEVVDYTIGLRDPTTNATIGTDFSDTLQPYEMRRYLDVFGPAGANAPAVDYSNVRVAFFKATGSAIVGAPAFVPFCTVQESTFFGADFRIAKSDNSNNTREQRTSCYGQNPCGTLDNTQSFATAAAATSKNIYYTHLAAPDFMKCELVGPRAGELEMKLRGPGDTILSPDWPAGPAPYTSGGNDQTFIYMSTGLRSQFNSGATGRWFIDVGLRESLPVPPTYPLYFGFTCHSGNGQSYPWFRTSTADDF